MSCRRSGTGARRPSSLLVIGRSTESLRTLAPLRSISRPVLTLSVLPLLSGSVQITLARRSIYTGDSTVHLNPAAFARPAPGQLGTLGKGSVRGKAITNIDFSMAKNWRYNERYGFQFRAEFFNIFNHPNFVGFDTDIRNCTFGTLNTMSGAS